MIIAFFFIRGDVRKAQRSLHADCSFGEDTSTAHRHTFYFNKSQDESTVGAIFVHIPSIYFRQTLQTEPT